jgi:hypothetical protein
MAPEIDKPLTISTAEMFTQYKCFWQVVHKNVYIQENNKTKRNVHDSKKL